MSNSEILKASKFVVTGLPGTDERAITFELPLKKGDKGVQVLVIRDFLGVGMFESDVFDDATKDALRKWQLEHKTEISEFAGLIIDEDNSSSADRGWFSEFGVVRPATFMSMMQVPGATFDNTGLKKIQESAQRVLEYLDTKSELIKGSDLDSKDYWNEFGVPEDTDRPPTRDGKFIYVTWLSGKTRADIGDDPSYRNFVESTSELALRSAVVKAFKFYGKSPVWKPDPNKGTWNEIMDYQNFPTSLRNEDLQLTIAPVPTAALAGSAPTVDILYGQDLRERAKPIFAAIKKIHSPGERPGSTFKFSVAINRHLFDPIPAKGTLHELPSPEDLDALQEAKAEVQQLAADAASNWLESSRDEIDKATSEIVEKCIARMARNSESDGLDKDGIRAALRDELLARAEKHAKDVSDESFPACREYNIDALLAGEIRDEHGSFRGEGLIQTVVTRMNNYEIQMQPWRLVGGRFQPGLRVPSESRELKRVIEATKELIRTNDYTPQPGDKIRFCFDEVKRLERVRPLFGSIKGLATKFEIGDHKANLQPWAQKPPMQLVTAGLKVLSVHIVKKNKEEIEFTSGIDWLMTNERPWNNPRTMGYLYNIEEMYKISRNSNLCSTTKPMPGTKFFKKFTHRIPALKTVFLLNEFKSTFPPFSNELKTAAKKLEEDLAIASGGAWKASITAEQAMNPASITDKLPAGAACTLEGLFAEFLDIFDFTSLFCNFAGCIPDIPWPLEFDWDFDFQLPMLPKLPSWDPLGFLLEMLLLMIISIILGILCGIARAILDLLKDLLSIPGFPGCKDLLDVGDKELCELLGPEASSRAECIDKGVDCLEKMGIPVEHYSELANLFDEVSLVLTPAELCALLGGNAPPEVIGIIKEIINKTKPTLKDYIGTESQIEMFFSCMGDLIDPSVCGKIARLSNVVISDEVCPEKEIPSLRQRLKDLGASPEEIKAAMADAAKKRDAIKDLFAKDPLQDSLPPVGCPDQGGLPGPYDNEHSQKANTVAVKGALNALEMSYKMDLTSYVPAFFEQTADLPGEDDMDVIDFHIHMNLMKQMQDLQTRGEDPTFRDPRRASTESQWIASEGEKGNIYKPYLWIDENEKIQILATPEEHRRAGYPILVFHPSTASDEKKRWKSIDNIKKHVTAYRSTIEDGKLFQERLASRFLPANAVRKTKVIPLLKSLMKSNYAFGYSYKNVPGLWNGTYPLPVAGQMENFINNLPKREGFMDDSHELVVLGTNKNTSIAQLNDITHDDIAYQELPIGGHDHDIKDCFNIISHTIDRTLRPEDREEQMVYRVRTANFIIPPEFKARRLNLANEKAMGSPGPDSPRSLRPPMFADLFVNAWIRELEAHRDNLPFIRAAREAAFTSSEYAFGHDPMRHQINSRFPFFNSDVEQITDPRTAETRNLQDKWINQSLEFLNTHQSLNNLAGWPDNNYQGFYRAQATAFLEAIGESISESKFFDPAQLEALNTKLVAAFVECDEEPCQGPMGNEGDPDVPEEEQSPSAIVPATAEKPCIKKNDIALDFEQLKKDIMKAYNESLCEPENDPVTRDFREPGPLENAIADQMIFIYIMSFALEFVMKGIFLFSEFDGEDIMQTRIISSYMKDYLESKILEEVFGEEEQEDSQRIVDRIKKITNEDDFNIALDKLIARVMKNAKKTITSVSNKLFMPKYKSYKEKFFEELALGSDKIEGYKQIQNPIRRGYINIGRKFFNNHKFSYDAAGNQQITAGSVSQMKLTHGCFYLEEYFRFSKTFLVGLMADSDWLRNYEDVHEGGHGRREVPVGDHRHRRGASERNLIPLNAYFGPFNEHELNGLLNYFAEHGSPALVTRAGLDGEIFPTDKADEYETLAKYLISEPGALTAGVRLMYIPPANESIRRSIRHNRRVWYQNEDEYDESRQAVRPAGWKSDSRPIQPRALIGRDMSFNQIVGQYDDGLKIDQGLQQGRQNQIRFSQPSLASNNHQMFTQGDTSNERSRDFTVHKQWNKGANEFITTTRAFLGSPTAGFETHNWFYRRQGEMEALVAAQEKHWQEHGHAADVENTIIHAGTHPEAVGIIHEEMTPQQRLDRFNELLRGEYPIEKQENLYNREPNHPNIFPLLPRRGVGTPSGLADEGSIVQGVDMSSGVFGAMHVKDIDTSTMGQRTGAGGAEAAGGAGGAGQEGDPSAHRGDPWGTYTVFPMRVKDGGTIPSNVHINLQPEMDQFSHEDKRGISQAGVWPPEGRGDMTPTPIYNFEKSIDCLGKFLLNYKNAFDTEGEVETRVFNTIFLGEIQGLMQNYKEALLKEHFGMEKDTDPRSLIRDESINEVRWRLTSEPSEDIRYLFDFVFPLDRYVSLFLINHITILDRNEDLAELFDGTRAAANMILRAMITPPTLDDSHLSLDGDMFSAAMASQGSEGPMEELKRKLKDFWPMIKKAIKMAPIIAIRNTANHLDPAYKEMNKVYKKDPCKLRRGLTMGSLSNKGVVVNSFPYAGRPRKLTKEGLTRCGAGGALPLYVPVNRVAGDIGKSVVALIMAALPFGPSWSRAAKPIKGTVQHLVNTALGTEFLENLGAGEETGKYGKLLFLPGLWGLSIRELPGEEHWKKQKEFQCISCDTPGRPMQPPPFCVDDIVTEEEE